jgi:excisionase family DNA binding protein
MVEQMTVRELARYLGIGDSRTHNWIRRGLLPVLKKGPRLYVDAEKLREWTAQNVETLRRARVIYENYPRRQKRELPADLAQALELPEEVMDSESE